MLQRWSKRSHFSYREGNDFQTMWSPSYSISTGVDIKPRSNHAMLRRTQELHLRLFKKNMPLQHWFAKLYLNRPQSHSPDHNLTEMQWWDFKRAVHKWLLTNLTALKRHFKGEGTENSSTVMMMSDWWSTENLLEVIAAKGGSTSC